MAKMGRPKIEINQKEFESLCKIGATADQLCYHFCIKEDTLNRFCKSKYKMTFAEYLKKNAAFIRTHLKRKQFEVAMSGNVTMLIWLGKQFLDQKDKVESEVKQTSIVLQADPDDMEALKPRDEN